MAHVFPTAVRSFWLEMPNSYRNACWLLKWAEAKAFTHRGAARVLPPNYGAVALLNNPSQPENTNPPSSFRKSLVSIRIHPYPSVANSHHLSQENYPAHNQ
jgi:hypothetical protein